MKLKHQNQAKSSFFFHLTNFPWYHNSLKSQTKGVTAQILLFPSSKLKRAGLGLQSKHAPVYFGISGFQDRDILFIKTRLWPIK